jgi:hypothetical protein
VPATQTLVYEGLSQSQHMLDMTVASWVMTGVLLHPYLFPHLIETVLVTTSIHMFEE